MLYTLYPFYLTVQSTIKQYNYLVVKKNNNIDNFLSSIDNTLQ